jgi:hypothetical protein
MLSDRTDLFSYGFFLGHKDFFVELSKRMGFQLSMIVVQLQNSEELSLDELKEVSHALKRVVGENLRRTDLAFDHRQTGHEYAIVLPGASLEDASKVSRKVSRKLEAKLGTLADKVRFSFTSQSLHKEDRRRALLSREQFEARFDFLLRLQSRVALEIVVCAFELAGTSELTEEKRQEACGLLRQLFGDLLQNDEELCFAYQRSDTLISLVMPAVDLAAAQASAHHLKMLFAKRLADPRVSLLCTFHVVSPPDQTEYSHAQKAWTETEKILSASH